MNILIICNTYYQLIFAIQLKNTIFGQNYVCAFVSDHSKNSKIVADKVSEQHIFNEVHFVETKSLYNKKMSKIKKLIDCIKIGVASGIEYNKDLNKISINRIDEIMSFNYVLDIDSYYSYLTMNNSDIKISFFEEGILSYNAEQKANKKRLLIKLLRHLKRKKATIECFKSFYCYYPNLYKGNLNPVKVPRIKAHSKTSDDLKVVFSLDEKLDEYTQKYIFFTSVYDFEGGQPVGEYDLVCKIADLVGKDNLLVKTHPRDTRSIYIDNGFNVDKNSSIPWEAIQLSGDFSDKVFMTVNSGSVLSGSTMSEKPVKTFYMYKLCDISGNESCRKNARDIECLLSNPDMKDILRTVHIAERLEDILG